MEKQSEVALATIKRICDTATKNGGIFNNIDEVLDGINSYNYLVQVCKEHFHLKNDNKKLEELRKQVAEKGIVVPDNGIITN